MPRSLAALTLLLLIAMVLTRVVVMKRHGVRAMYFGRIDKMDFLIPSFALFYFYVVFAAAFGFPAVGRQEFFHSEITQWAGVLFCVAGLALFL
jgi:hypothetical protein